MQRRERLEVNDVMSPQEWGKRVYEEIDRVKTRSEIQPILNDMQDYSEPGGIELQVGEYGMVLDKGFIPMILGAHREILEITKPKASDDGVNVRESFYMTTYYDVDNDGKKIFRWGCVWKWSDQFKSYNGPDAGTLDVLEKASTFLAELAAVPNLPVKLKTPLQKHLPDI